MASFQKYIGGSPTNMAAGTARLGLKSGLITRVGDEHMGRFIRETLAAEGVDVRGVVTDPERLTALVILGIRDQHDFPMIFFRENCADMALCEDDIDPALIADTRAGRRHRHPPLATPGPRPPSSRRCRLARENGARTALDIDYRPNLWGLAGHAEGFSRFVESAEVTAKLQSTLHLFDLIVGTEEEFHIAGGSTDTLAALRAVRAVSAATLICKRGAAGAAAFEGAIPASLDEGQTGPGFPIEVFNVLGAGDGFMSGLLKGWLTDQDWPTALSTPTPAAPSPSRATAAPRPTRPGTSSSSSSTAASDPGAAQGRRARADPLVDQPPARLAARCASSPSTTACSSRRSPTSSASPHDRIGAFKRLCLEAARRVAAGRHGYGILCDGRLGRDALYAAAGSGLWIGRPVELPGSRPLRLEADIEPDYGSALAEWPLEHVVKVLCFYHPDDSAEMKADQEATVARLFRAARANRLEFLLEIIPSKVAPVTDTTSAEIIQRFYDLGVYPDWWKLEPMKTDAAWANAAPRSPATTPTPAASSSSASRRRPTSSPRASPSPPATTW